MAQILVKYYDLVGKQGGMQAKMRLAVKTGVSSVKAQEEPDSPELKERFYLAAKEILGSEIDRL